MYLQRNWFEFQLPHEQNTYESGELSLSSSAMILIPNIYCYCKSFHLMAPFGIPLALKRVRYGEGNYLYGELFPTFQFLFIEFLGTLPSTRNTPHSISCYIFKRNKQYIFYCEFTKV